ncbi:MAG: SpoIVB peptidase [Clostridia bacterium]|nr:SpoIVB peptidase [Clostridia bacterium]
MKIGKISLLIIVFTLSFIYITNIDKIPDEIILFQDESYEISCLKGIDVTGDNVSNSNSLFRNLVKVRSSNIGKDKFTVSVFGGVMKKDVSVKVLPATNVVIGGDAVGIRLYSKGVLVIGKMPVQGTDGKWYEPYSQTKIEIGDIITKINDIEIETINELTEAINRIEYGDKVEIEYVKDDAILKEKVLPVSSFEDGMLKLGLWVRDGAMGVGTLTFINNENKTFAALGHGISDFDVKELIVPDSGVVNVASILDVRKGEKNSPGEIKGLLVEDVEIGTIEENNENGIFGKSEELSNYFRGRKTLPVASKNEVELGKASIYCTVDKDNYPKEYEVKILKTSDALNSTKGMMIKVTDEELIKKTGGIVQGMSGSPIVQNGKIIGAVTHVYVSDPTRGYGIFIENMM